MTAANIERAREALNHIPSDLPREDWVTTGMAAQAAGLGFEDFDSWSAQAGNYNERDARDTWRSFKPGKGIGAGTLFRVAAEHGFDLYIKKSHSKTVQPQVRPATPRRGSTPAEVWDRALPATAGHAYIVRKGAAGVPLAGLRVLPDGDQLRIAGNSMAGALVVPAYGPGGAMQSLQLIPIGGKKLNLPGCQMAGARFLVGDLVPDVPLYLVEGIGAAWAVWQATGRAAVVCFGWGNVGRVAADLRQKGHALVLVPDTDKEADAARIALEHGCAVAAMPDGWPPNSDVGDLAAKEGHDVLAELLGAASKPQAADTEPHPLAQFVEIGAEPKPPMWVIPGFVAEGVCVIAGSRGVGKTTALIPLALTAAGIHEPDYPLAPRHWRHVVYITEDLNQAERIINGYARHVGLDLAVVRERVHMVNAKRLPPSYVAEVGEIYSQQFTRTAQDVDLLPLVVIDTMAATLHLDSENDNSEASVAIAALKQDFAQLPVWVIGHLAKANLTRSDASSLTMRGAGAFEADAHQVLCLVREEETRWLVPNKVRFDPRWHELQFESHWTTVAVFDRWGNPETMTLRWAIARPPESDRKAQAEEARKEQRKSDEAQLRDDIRAAVQIAWQTGHPLNREGVKAQMGRKHTEVVNCIERLISEQWLHEVFIPSKERLHPRRGSYLVSLDTTERESMLRGEPLPQAKQVIPPSWKKPASSIPYIDAESAKEDGNAQPGSSRFIHSRFIHSP